MKIVLLTNGNIQADRILKALHANSCGVQTIFLEKPQQIKDYLYDGEILSPWTRFKAAIRRVRNEIRLRASRRRLSQFANVEWVPAANSVEMVSRLRAASPEYILLGGIGILREEVINAASNGVLNAHPGLLPWLRGVDVVPNAILREVGLGASVHFISPQIDTGLLLSRRLIELNKDLYSLQYLEEQCNQLAALLVSEVVSNILSGAAPKGVPLGLEYKLCRRLTRSEKETLNRSLDYSRLASVNQNFKSLV